MMFVRISFSFADYSLDSLTTHQVLRIVGIIQHMWRMSPVNLDERSRKDVPKLFLAGHHRTVAELSLSFPESDKSTAGADSESDKDALKVTTKPTSSNNTYQPSGITNVSRYYTNDRKYGGLDSESLPRAKAHFTATCDKFGVQSDSRKLCIDLALKPSVHNLPRLVQDNLATNTEEGIWTLIHNRVYTADRMNRIRSEWQTTSTFHALATETLVQTFERIVERLSLLQSQLPKMYHSEQTMVDKS